MTTSISKSSTVSIGLAIVLAAGIIAAVMAWKDLAHGQENLRHELERTVRAIQESRWCELDDKMYMQAFARQNDLVMPTHSRVRGHNSLGVPGGD
jgi:hypothetical protein